MARQAAGALMQAINVRWAQNNLQAELPGGITWGMPSERPQLAHAIVDNVNAGPYLWTNKSRFDKVMFDISIYDVTKELVEQHADVIDTALTLAPLILMGGVGSYLLLLDPGIIRYGEENLFQKAVIPYIGRVRNTYGQPT